MSPLSLITSGPDQGKRKPFLVEAALAPNPAKGTRIKPAGTVTLEVLWIPFGGDKDVGLELDATPDIGAMLAKKDEEFSMAKEEVGNFGKEGSGGREFWQGKLRR